MAEHMTEAEKRAHLREVMADFDTAMLVTRSESGPRARPLAVARSADGEPEGVLYFPTSISSPKVQEIADDPLVCVTMQDKRRFVSVSGTAQIKRDRRLVSSLWTDAWRVWFPEGKDDPDLCLVAVIPTAAEYWDQTGGKGLAYLFEAARSLMEGKTPDPDDDRQNAKVRPTAPSPR
jgi:general stress protein 26